MIVNMLGKCLAGNEAVTNWANFGTLGMVRDGDTVTDAAEDKPLLRR